MPNKILILGGTAEAVRTAQTLVDQGHNVTTSLAGRTKEPAPVAGELRIGGFGGASGLAEWINKHGIDTLIDATHPFARTISQNAAIAASKTGVVFRVVQRPPWHAVVGDNWIPVADLVEAAAAIPSKATAFLALGSQHLETFYGRDDIRFVVRMVDPPTRALPFTNCRLICGKPSLEWRDEAGLFADEAVTHLICRNSGGDGAYAKIEAARHLKLPVIMVERSQ